MNSSGVRFFVAALCVVSSCGRPSVEPEPDAGEATHDSGVVDSGVADAGTPDGSVPDDAGVPDAGVDDFGTPCTNGTECSSGICAQTSSGGVCTRSCTGQCPDGFRCGASVCWPRFESLCAPCTTDSACRYLANGVSTDDESACVNVADAGRFCAPTCTPGVVGDCPTGYACSQRGASFHCMKQDAQCACTTAFEGRSTTCNDGLCVGSRSCVNGALTSCSAQVSAAERCNGVDDDCDGTVDNGGNTLCAPDGISCHGTSCGGAAGCSWPLLAGRCEIDGGCQTDEEANPSNVCLKCSAAASTSSWSFSSPTTQCAPSSLCFTAGFCDAGTCAQSLIQDSSEPNEARASSRFLGTVDDDDGSAISVAARLSSTTDVDWFRVTFVEGGVGSIHDGVVLSVGSSSASVRVCSYVQCTTTSNASTTCTNGSIADSSQPGFMGCCKVGSSPSFINDYDCANSGINDPDDATVYMSVSTLTGPAVCAPYSLSVHF